MDNDKWFVKQCKALSDEKRIKVLSLLQNGEKCACVLMEEINIAQSALSYHMKILCDAGVVKARQDGKWMHYSLQCEGLEAIAHTITALTTTAQTKSSKCCQ